MIGWSALRSTVWAGETTQGVVPMAQEREGVTGPGSTPSQESGEGQNQSLKKDAKKALRDLNEQIAALGTQFKGHGSKVEAGAKESWNDLKEKQRDAKMKLKELSSAGGEVREKAKSDFKAALDDLRKSYHKAVSYFK
jgi:archaellum component FlaC